MPLKIPAIGATPPTPIKHTIGALAPTAPAPSSGGFFSSANASALVAQAQGTVANAAKVVSDSWDTRRGQFEQCLRAANAEVDACRAPENGATYAKCWPLKPGEKYLETPLSNCMEIYGQRLRDGVHSFRAPNSRDQLNAGYCNWTLRNPVFTGNDLSNYCYARAKMADPSKYGFSQWLTDAVNASGQVYADIPVVGDLAKVALSAATGPLMLASDIASGARLDRALMAQFERDIKNIKTVAPYAQAVISFVPGIGPIASAAIGTGLALASGRPIDEALLEGVKGALPGGPIAAAAFDVGVGVMQGKPIEEIGIAVLPIPQTAKDTLSAGARVTRALASGQPVTQAFMNEIVHQLPAASQAVAAVAAQSGAQALADTLMQQGRDLLPADLQKQFGTAIATGMAVSEGQRLQLISAMQAHNPQFQSEIALRGKMILMSDPTVMAAYNLVPDLGKRGFEYGAGLISFKLSENDLTNIRNLLSPEEQKGFDAAVSLQIGRAKANTPKRMKTIGRVQTPMQATLDRIETRSAAIHITNGMLGATPDQKENLMRTLAADPDARAGAAHAIETIKMPWWKKFLRFLGLGL
jgi:hypothetical protein